MMPLTNWTMRIEWPSCRASLSNSNFESVGEAVGSSEDAARMRVRRALEDKRRRLTSEQAQPYLNQNRRTAASLLAAFRATGDEVLLREAKGSHLNL